MQDEEKQAPEVPKNELTASVSWEASEYLHHEKDFVWMTLLIAVTFFLAVVTYFLIEDVFSVAVIVLMAVAMAVYGYRKPRTLTYQINSEGVIVSGRLYEYDKFRSFSIIDEGAVKSILLEPLKRFMPPMSIYYAPDDEDKISEVLSAYLPYRKRELAFVDRLFKKLRF